MAKKKTASSYPRLDLVPMRARSLRVTLQYPFSRSMVRSMRVLAKGADEKDHVEASASYDTNGATHGVIMRVHLRPAAIDAPFVEIEYRRRQRPRRTPIPPTILWRHIVDPKATPAGPQSVKAVAEVVFDVGSGDRLPVALPLIVPELGGFGDIVGLRLVRREGDKVAFTMTLDLERRGTMRLRFIFARDLDSVADAPTSMLAAAVELRELMTVRDRQDD